MKKKIHKLQASGTNPFKLMAISSHENDYRLSWAVNEKLGVKFIKTDNITLPINNYHGQLEFSVFQHVQEDKALRMNLISNICPDGFLINEMKNIDFFLQVFGDTNQTYLENIIANLKEIEIVSAVFEILPGNFKRKWNLPPE